MNDIAPAAEPLSASLASLQLAPSALKKSEAVYDRLDALGKSPEKITQKTKQEQKEESDEHDWMATKLKLDVCKKYSFIHEKQILWTITWIY